MVTIIRRIWARVLQLSQTKRNLFANIFGNGWAALIQLLVIPIYIHLLGEEAYGLFAFYLTIIGFAQVFDLGFTPTINRELARYSVLPDKIDEARTLTRTMEVVYILVGVVLGIAIALTAPFLAQNWLKANALSGTTVQTALLLMAVLAVVQWPLTFYQGSMNGLQKQTRLVALQVTTSALKHGGGVVVLLIAPTILALLAWLIIATMLHSALAARLLWKNIPPSNGKTHFNLLTLKPVRHFAIGAALTSLAGVPLTQAAPILLSRSVSLSEYGHYTIASVYAGVIIMLYMPIFTAIYPRLTALVEERNADIALNFFRFSGQFMALAIIPIGFTLATYSNEFLWMWQRDTERASSIAPIAAMFVAGNALVGLQHIPYALQLAHGNIKISLILSVFMGILQMPLLVWAIQRYAVAGAAGVFVLINAISLLLYILLTNLQIMPIGALKWVAQSIVQPSFASGVVFAISYLLGISSAGVSSLVLIILTALIAVIATALSMHLTRAWLLDKLRAFHTTSC